MEGHIQKVSNFRCAIPVSYVAVRQWVEILINRFFIKKLSMGGGDWPWIYLGWWWVVVDGGQWWWICFSWWWVVVDGGGSWWVVA